MCFVLQCYLNCEWYDDFHLHDLWRASLIIVLQWHLAISWLLPQSIDVCINKTCNFLSFFLTRRITTPQAVQEEEGQSLYWGIHGYWCSHLKDRSRDWWKQVSESNPPHTHTHISQASTHLSRRITNIWTNCIFPIQVQKKGPCFQNCSFISEWRISELPFSTFSNRSMPSRCHLTRWKVRFQKTMVTTILRMRFLAPLTKWWRPIRSCWLMMWCSWSDPVWFYRLFDQDYKWTY